ncbi:MAG TPA: glycosyltransferase [Stellaceae bacterium]|nr:glycosyltransferase [Stellaceae bacterium]
MTGTAPARILFHGAEFAPGSVAVELASWLATRAVSVEVVAANDGEGWWRSEERDGIKITLCPRRRAHHGEGLSRQLERTSFALSSAPILLRRARALRPQLLAAIEPTASDLPALRFAARHAGAATWVHLPEGSLREGAGRRARWLAHIDHVSLAAIDADSVLTAAGVAEERRVALPPWTDTRAIFPLREQWAIRQSLEISKDAVVALYAGTLDETHGIEALLGAARRMPRNGALVFVVSGRGPAWRRLAAAAQQLPLRLVPWPRADALNMLLNLADIHLLPAGLAAGDALFPGKPAALLASGRPLIAGGPVPERLRAAVEPVPRGADALATAIVTLAAAPAEQIRRGEAARRTAQDYHEKQRVFRQLERALGLQGSSAA